MTPKNIVFLFILNFCSAFAFAIPLENLLPDNLVKQLLQSGTIDRERFDTPGLEMVPRFASLERLMQAHRYAVDPNLTMESLRLYKKPAARDWTFVEKIRLYNGLLAISSLQGLEYYSKSRNSMRLLYETSTVIDGPESRNPRPDPVFNVPPEEFSIFARQKDLTFGDNIYKFTYYSNETSIFVIIDNITALSYGPVTVIGKNKQKSVFAVIDSGPYLLVYGASLAKASMLPGMKQRAGESICNRANALLSWFTKKADKAFGRTG